VPLPVWLCVLFLFLVVTLCGVYLFRTVRAFWREVKSFTATLDGTAAGLAVALERLAERSTTFGSDFPRLEAALARLATSRRRLAVLQAALQDVQDAVGRVAAVYPRK
jgi:hypothetical protein